MSYYKTQLKEWLAKKNIHAGKVLSIGAMNDDREYFASTDFDKYETLDITNEYKPDILHDMNLPIPEYNNKKAFDIIFAFELFEYLWNPVQAFKNFNDLLAKGGYVYLSVPFLYPTHNPTDQDFLRVTEWGIKKILKETGFEIVEFEYRIWKDPGGWHRSVSEDGMRFAKDYKHHNATGFLIVATKI